MSPGLTSGMITASLIGFAGVLGLLAVVDYVLIARTVTARARPPPPRRATARRLPERAPALSY